MKKICLFALFAAFTMSFISCENSNNKSDEDLLIGTWKKVGGESIVKFTFYKDGTFNYYNNENLDCYDESIDGNAYGLWTLSNRILTMSATVNHAPILDEYLNQTRTILSLSETKLTMFESKGNNTDIYIKQ